MSTRQFKKKIYEKKDIEDRFLNLIFPKEAIGSYVDDEAKESGFILTFIILSLIICSIITTITYLNVISQGDVHQNTKDLILISTIFSWTLFVSFIFLLFSATRLFHLTLFIGLITTGVMTLKGLRDQTDKNMIITTVVFASFSLAVLFYYFTLSRTVTDSIEYREKERLVRLDNKYKDRIERVRETAEENLNYVKREREFMNKEYIKIAEKAQKLEEKVEQRKKERDFLKKKIKQITKENKYDNDSSSSDSD